MTSTRTPQNPVFVALDVDSGDKAMKLARDLRPHVGGFKIGLELFTSEGARIVEEVGAHDVFLDLKFHDIPNTVRGASRAAAKMGVKIFNVHCLGGLEMMRAAREAIDDVSNATSSTRSQVIGVTILTSHDRASLARLGLDEEPQVTVRRLALLAREAGLDGVVCSPHEIEVVRKECGGDFLIVTPGVRPADAELGDQKRVMTPREALDAGATWLVVGRPITAAKNPVEAAANIARELGQTDLKH